MGTTETCAVRANLQLNEVRINGACTVFPRDTMLLVIFLQDSGLSLRRISILCPCLTLNVLYIVLSLSCKPTAKLVRTDMYIVDNFIALSFSNMVSAP